MNAPWLQRRARAVSAGMGKRILWEMLDQLPAVIGLAAVTFVVVMVILGVAGVLR